jgi:serine acetyltransferase
MNVFMFDDIREDLRAYNGKWGAQGFWAMVVYRFGRWRCGVRLVFVRKFLSLIYRALYKVVQIVTGIELPCEVVVGRNLVIDHFGGIVISGYARFGDNCRIRDGVVVGLRRVDEKCAPIIGNNVDMAQVQNCSDRLGLATTCFWRQCCGTMRRPGQFHCRGRPGGRQASPLWPG